MAGCTKAGRKKKSRSNQAYIMGRRQEVNKAKKQARIKREKDKQDLRSIIPHGACRAERREAWMFAIGGMWENKDRLSFNKYETNL